MKRTTRQVWVFFLLFHVGCALRGIELAAPLNHYAGTTFEGEFRGRAEAGSVSALRIEVLFQNAPLFTQVMQPVLANDGTWSHPLGFELPPLNVGVRMPLTIRVFQEGRETYAWRGMIFARHQPDGLAQTLLKISPGLYDPAGKHNETWQSLAPDAPRFRTVEAALNATGTLIFAEDVSWSPRRHTAKMVRAALLAGRDVVVLQSSSTTSWAAADALPRAEILGISMHRLNVFDSENLFISSDLLSLTPTPASPEVTLDGVRLIWADDGWHVIHIDAASGARLVYCAVPLLSATSITPAAREALNQLLKPKKQEQP